MRSLAAWLILLLGVFPGGVADARMLRICAGIAPAGYLAERICGTNAQVSVLLPQGRSPHTYSPSPAEMVRLAEADIVLVTGVPFEWAVVDKLPDSLRTRVVDIGAGLRTRRMEAHGHEDHDGGRAIRTSGCPAATW